MAVGKESYIVEAGMLIKDQMTEPLGDIAKAMAGMSKFTLQGMMSAKGFGGAMRSLSYGLKSMRPGLLAFGGPIGLIGAGLATIGGAAADAAAAIGNVLASAVRFAIGVIRTAAGVVQRFAGAIMRLGKWAALGAALAFEEFTRRSLRAFAQFEYAIVRTVAIMDTAGTSFAKLKAEAMDFALDVSRRSAKSAAEIAEGMYAIQSAGFSAIEMYKATPGVIALAEAHTGDMLQTAELVTSQLRAFKLEAGDSNRVVNMFSAAIANSRLTLERLGYSLPYVSSTAAQLGLSIELTVASLAELVSNGIEASMAGTGLRGVFAALMKPTTEGSDALSKYGLRLRDVNIETHGFTAVLERLRKANISTTDQFAIFGRRIKNSAGVLIDAGKSLDSFVGKISDTSHAFETQKKQLDTLQGAWDIFKSTWEELKVRYLQGSAEQWQRVTEASQRFLDVMIKAEIPQRFGQMVGKAMQFMYGWAQRLVGRINWAQWFARLQQGARLQVARFRAWAQIVKEFVSEYWPKFRTFAVETYQKIANAVKTYGPIVIQWFKDLPGHIDTVRQWLAEKLPAAMNIAVQIVTLGGQAMLATFAALTPVILSAAAAFSVLATAAWAAALPEIYHQFRQGNVSKGFWEQYKAIPGAVAGGLGTASKLAATTTAQAPGAFTRLGEIREQTAAWAGAQTISGEVRIAITGDADMMRTMQGDPGAWSSFLETVSRALQELRMKPAL